MRDSQKRFGKAWQVTHRTSSSRARPWPFDPNTVAAPFHVVHGEQDTLLPLAHSRHTAEGIAESTLRVLPRHGDFTLLGEFPTMGSALGRSLP
jgi:pimeloyl-ACP methyl ester carboxylesterase